jgi:hypothetical protein
LDIRTTQRGPLAEKLEPPERRRQQVPASIAARIMDLQCLNLGRAKGTVRSGSDARLRAFTTAFKEAALYLSGVRPNGKMTARHPLIVPGQEDDLLVASPTSLLIAESELPILSPISVNSASERPKRFLTNCRTTYLETRLSGRCRCAAISEAPAPRRSLRESACG